MSQSVVFSNQVRVRDKALLKYSVKYTGITDTPVAMTLRYIPVENGEEWESTLYFDAQGRIVDRAPMVPGISARGLQDGYAQIVYQDLGRHCEKDGTPVREQVYPLVSGFFQGESGIARVQYFPDLTVVHSEV